MIQINWKRVFYAAILFFAAMLCIYLAWPILASGQLTIFTLAVGVIFAWLFTLAGCNAYEAISGKQPKQPQFFIGNFLVMQGFYLLYFTSQSEFYLAFAALGVFLALLGAYFCLKAGLYFPLG